MKHYFGELVSKTLSSIICRYGSGACDCAHSVVLRQCAFFVKNRCQMFGKLCTGFFLCRSKNILEKEVERSKSYWKIL